MVAPLLLGVILVLASPGSSSSSPACALLTSSDVEGATGVKPDDPHPGHLAMPGSSESIPMCSWIVKSQLGQLIVMGTRMPAGQSADALVKNNPGTAALRAQGYKEEAKEYGNAWCSVMTPPASMKDGQTVTTCIGAPRGYVVSISWNSPSTKLSLEKAKALLDKASARVP